MNKSDVISSGPKKPCKRCKSNAQSGLKCIKCGVISHPACVWLMKGEVMLIDEETINCCLNENDSTSQEEIPRSPILQDSEQISLYLQQIRHLKEIIAEKDSLIHQQTETIDALKSQIIMMKENQTSKATIKNVSPKSFAEIKPNSGGTSADTLPKHSMKKSNIPGKNKKKEETRDKKEKSKDPFDAMPKGTFNIDDFKRFYSHEDEAKSIPYFWEKFDPENYSIWYCEYKYPKELTKIFMSCNLITGMFQRLDKMRKQAFASVCLFGEDNNSSISGVWVWRGHELAFTLSPDWQIDYEFYDWKKLDPNSYETKKLVEQYFSWTGTDKRGRKFNQGKVFK